MPPDVAPEVEIAVCPMCGAGEATPLRQLRDRVWARPGEFGLVRCTRCALVYLSPRPPRASIGFYYQDLYAGGEGEGVDAEEKLQRSGIARALNRGRARALFRRQPAARAQRHLDVGCGVGGFLAEIATRTTAVGVDFDPAAIGSARRHAEARGLALELHVGTLADQSFPDASLATASMIHFLEHSYDPRAELVATHRLLADGGAIVVEVPSERSLARRVFGSFWFPYLAPQHLTLFSRATLARLLAEAGFRDIQVRDAYAPFVWVASFLLWYQHLLGKRSRFVDALWAKAVSLIVAFTLLPLLVLLDLLFSPFLPRIRCGEHILATAVK